MQIKNHTLILSIALTFLFALGFYVFAWTAPTKAPTDDNVAAPINVGPDPQKKTGGIEMTYSILTPGSAPAETKGTMYFDSATSKFKCYQNDVQKFVDCIGGGYLNTSSTNADILIVANPGRADGSAQIKNILGPFDKKDAANKEYVDSLFVLAQVSGAGDYTAGVKGGTINLWRENFKPIGSVVYNAGEVGPKDIGTIPSPSTELAVCLEVGGVSTCNMSMSHTYNPYNSNALEFAGERVGVADGNGWLVPTYGTQKAIASLQSSWRGNSIPAFGAFKKVDVTNPTSPALMNLNFPAGSAPVFSGNMFGLCITGGCPSNPAVDGVKAANPVEISLRGMMIVADRTIAPAAACLGGQKCATGPLDAPLTITVWGR